MSAIVLDNRIVHYELVGRRGQPIIFLHSWLGSWRYWLPTMEYVSERYRAYALDFWGFGESDQRESQFSITEYVDMLRRFMENMGMSRVVLVGHGLGGMVAVRAATEYPELFTKVMIVNTPIDGAQLQTLVRPGAFSRLLGRATPTNIWARQLREMKLSDPVMRSEIIADTEALSERVVDSVLSSILETDLNADLARLETPLLGLYGERDSLVTPGHLHEELRSFQQSLILPKAGHFPFLDQSTVFYRALMDYLSSNGESAVELKNEWRRRVSQWEYL
ncbi:MAG: alpha/beta hydrolase [Roseiflexaceae bacterium]|nr:alpha/beta hydrolase [Roseiflexaceae bacterium]